MGFFLYLQYLAGTRVAATAARCSTNEEERSPASYADATANGGNRGGRWPPRPPPVAAPTPTHVSRVQTVLIDVMAIKPSHDRADRAALIIDDMQLPAVTVTAIFMLQVEQLLLVTFATDEVFQEAVTKLRRGVPWGAAAGRHVYGWPTTDSLLQVRLTNVHPDIPVDRLTGLMSRFGRVVLAHWVGGRDPFFPNANDGIIHMKMAVNEGSTFPDFIAIETVNGVLDSIVRVFTDNSQKRCYRCGQLGHIGAFCRWAARTIADQKDVWARLTLHPTQLQIHPNLQRVDTGPPLAPVATGGGQEALPGPPVVEDRQEAAAALGQPGGSQGEDPDSFLPGVSPFQLSLATQRPAGSQAGAGGPVGPELQQKAVTDSLQFPSNSQQGEDSPASQDGLEDSTMSSHFEELPLGQQPGPSTSAGPPISKLSRVRSARPSPSLTVDGQSRVASRSPRGSGRSNASSISPSGRSGRQGRDTKQKRKTPATSLSPRSGANPKDKGVGKGRGRGGRPTNQDEEDENGGTSME